MIFDTKLNETSLPVIWLENIDWKIRVGPYATNDTQLILIFFDPVDDEDVEELRVHELNLSSNNWQCDLKKRKN